MPFERKQYFVGIDSDGTMFDSMTIKHTHAFIPKMIEVFRLGEIADKVKTAAEYINLYGNERGINRFPGLVRTFEEVERVSDFKLENYDDLRAFVKNADTMSNAALAEYESNHPSEFLQKVLFWSKESDLLFAEKMRTQPPFKNARLAVENMCKSADVGIISSAGAQSLREDWGREGLLEKTAYVAGQEMGSKAEQLNTVINNNGYEKKHCLMIGDALGDMEAAKDNGIFFYPIIPLREESMWKAFYETYFNIFLNGCYAEVEKELIADFLGQKR